MARFSMVPAVSIPLPDPAPHTPDKRQSVCLCVCLDHPAIWSMVFHWDRVQEGIFWGVVGVSSKKKKKKKYRYIPHLLPSCRMSLNPTMA